MVIPDNCTPRIIDHFPESVRELVRVGGLNATIALINHYGGSRLSFSSESNRQHLVSIIGVEALTAFRELHGSEFFNLPTCVSAKSWLKRQMIFEGMRQGLSNSAMARINGCSERWITKVRKRYQAEYVNPL